MKSYQVTDPYYDDSEQTMDTNSTQAILANLYTASTYTIYVRAVNEIGAGPISISVKTVIPATGKIESRREEGREGIYLL